MRMNFLLVCSETTVRTTAGRISGVTYLTKDNKRKPSETATFIVVLVDYLLQKFAQ